LAGNPPSSPSITNTPPRPEKNYCPGGGTLTAGPNDKLAAKVNDQGIPLAIFDRQTAQAQAAFAAQGMDPKSQQGQESMKAVRDQVLDQLIGDVLIEQAAKKAGVTVSENDVNSRIQGLINDAGGESKFNDYLKTNQLQLGDLCVQLRAQVFGEVMLDRVTASLPTKAEQVHAAHILFASADDANKVIPLIKQGQDFGALAKQY
jgi:parvulin-like peptidyl-prolyl isomerase